MDIKLVIFIVWLPQAVFQALKWAYWIQVKEYRLDRLAVFLRSRDAQDRLDLALWSIKLLLSLSFVVLGIRPWLAVSFLLLINVSYFIRLIKEGMVRPVASLRATVIFSFSVALAGGVFLYFLLNNSSLFLLFAEVSLLTLPFVVLLLTYPAVMFSLFRLRRQVKQKREAYPDLKVIGVSGSFAKTTTKDFIAQLLSVKYRVVETFESENTHFAVYRAFLKKVNRKTEIFVAEIGAYKKGEIAFISNPLKLDLGVITGIDIQHLALFGSLKNLKEAKFELIEAIKEGGIAVFNSGSQGVSVLMKKAESKRQDIKLFSYEENKEKAKSRHQANKALWQSAKAGSLTGLSFRLGKEEKYLPVQEGVHFAENIAGALLVARLLGVGWQEIERALLKLKLPRQTMAKRVLSQGVIVLDDTRNTSPKSFGAAVDYLAKSKGDRILVTPGIIELGKEEARVHLALARKIEAFNLTVFTTSRSVYDHLLKGGVTKLFYLKSSQELAKKCEELKKLKDATILLEGRLPRVVKDSLL